MSVRKPHNNNVGYICELKCKRDCGGYIVIYNRFKQGIDADHKYIVVHEPSGNIMSFPSLPKARDFMKFAASNEYEMDIEFLPTK